MNLVAPSLDVLRKLAQIAADSHDPAVRAWLAEIAPRKRAPSTRAHNCGGVSIVATKRDGRLIGYAVWRHFAGDPKRRKARAWFGVPPTDPAANAERAREEAEKFAAFLRSLSEHELREWWANRNSLRAQQGRDAFERERALIAEKAAAKAKRQAEREQRAAEVIKLRKERAAAKAKLKAELAASRAQRQAERAKRRAAREAAAAHRRAMRAGKVKGLVVQVHRGRVIAYVAVRRVCGVAIRASFSVKKWTEKTGRENAAYEEAVKAVKWMQAETPAALLEWRKTHTTPRPKYRRHRSYSPVPGYAGGKLRGYTVQRLGCSFWFPATALKKAEALASRIGSMTKDQLAKRLARHRTSDRAVSPRRTPLGVVGYEVRVGPVRMYFDKAEWRSHYGYDSAARMVAGKVARRLKSLDDGQLTAVWARYQAIAPQLKALETPDNFNGVVMDFESLSQITHVYQRAS